jgi:hypothetical protein
MIRGRGALLLFVALLMCAAYTIAAPDTSTRSADHTTAVTAPAVRSERAVLAPVTEPRALPLALVFGFLAPAAVVAAALAGPQRLRLPSPRRSRPALQIPRLRGPPSHSSC